MSLQQIPGHYIVSASGGGGGDTPTALVNTGISAWVSGVVTGNFTAEQNVQPNWITLGFDTGGDPWSNQKWASAYWSSLSGATAFRVEGTNFIYGTTATGNSGDAYLTTANGSYYPTASKQIFWTAGNSTSVVCSSTASWNGTGSFYPLNADTVLWLRITIDKVCSPASSVNGMSVDDGNGVVPYPDRPKTASGSSAASASAYQWQSSNSFGTKYIDENSYESAGTISFATPEKLWEVNSAAQVGSISNAISSYYPSTAYAISIENVHPTASASGNWR